MITFSYSVDFNKTLYMTIVNQFDSSLFSQFSDTLCIDAVWEGRNEIFRIVVYVFRLRTRLEFVLFEIWNVSKIFNHSHHNIGFFHDCLARIFLVDAFLQRHFDAVISNIADLVFNDIFFIKNIVVVVVNVFFINERIVIDFRAFIVKISVIFINGFSVGNSNGFFCDGFAFFLENL